jgi:PST family polysaccharide transporter
MLRNSLILIGAAQVLILLVGLGRAKALAVLAGPSGLGVIATIDQLVVTLTQFGALGLPYTALKFMSAAHSRSPEAFRGAYAAYMRTMIVLALATAGGVFVLFSLRPGMFGAEAARYSNEIRFALLGVAPIMVTFLLAQTFAAAQKPVQAALFNLASAGGLAVAGIGGLIMTNLAGLYAATATTGFVIAAAAIAYLQKSEGLSLFSAGASIRSEMTKDSNVLNTALSVYVTLVGYAACLLVVRYALFDTVGEAATGLLQSALAAALSFGAVIAAMVNLSLAPALNRDGRDADKIGTANVFAGKILLLLFLGAVPVALFPRTVLTLLYTGEFAAAATALTLCIVWQCFHQIMAVYQQLLIGLNQVRYMAFCAIAGFAIAGVLAYVLVPSMGVSAGPVALIAGTIVNSALTFARLAAVNNFRAPWRLALRAGFLAAAVMGAGFLFNADSEWTLAGLAARGAYGVALCAALWFILEASERKLILSAPGALIELTRRRAG